MVTDGKILMGKGEEQVFLIPSMLNRHGLIAGATGTGKTITLKVMAEGLSDIGVPVFLADIKGDVSGTALSGTDSEKMQGRLTKVGINPAEFTYHGYPSRFWDVYGKGGTPVRATISDMGPLMLSRILDLTDVQEGVLNIVFKVADDKGWKLIDFKDLKAMLTYTGEHSKELMTTYGNVSSQSIGAIQRSLLTLEDAGAEQFFGEPNLDVTDWMQTDKDGHGIINVLHCVELYQHPALYATFMLWLLSELFEVMPEAGDADKPKMVFFFDEAHLLFNDAPKVLVEKIVQVVKLIRSKGIGIFFITQSPSDIPDDVLAQLNNRVQHALRAYTPAEQKAVRAAAQSFRPNPAFKTEDVIGSLGTGCALVSFLDEEGVPSIVQQAMICPPQSAMKALDDAARAQLITMNPLHDKYSAAIDNESAYEILNEQKQKADEEKKAAEEAEAAKKQEEEAEKEKEKEQKEKDAEVLREARLAKAEATIKNGGRTSRKRESVVEKGLSSAARSIGRDVGKQITRGILGSSHKTVEKAAGSLVSNLLGGLFH
ncbi:MAG: DUF853 family protein [Lachnospiraceae bacterium]|nr:DUF853 family protein [Lachnospiraceae bacterium]